MPMSPYAISAVTYSDAGVATANLLNGATAILRNVTTNEIQTQTSNSLGEIIFDALNFTSQYSNSDRLQLTLFFGNGSNRIVLDRRHTIDITVGFYDAGNLILHPLGDHYLSTSGAKTAMLSYSISNEGSSAARVDFFDRKNDRLVFHVKVAADASITCNFGMFGKELEGGICVIYSDESVTAVTYPGDTSSSSRPTITVALTTK